MMSIKSDLYNLYLNANIKGIKEPTLIFQSDDWGSQRMPDLKTFELLKKQSWLDVEACYYTKTDSLENVNEVDNLLNVLSSFKDKRGNSPVFTLNMNLYNPNFAKMKESKFESYYEMDLENSYQYYNSGDVLKTLQKAKKSNLIDIQYHGKQHFNIGEYMSLLQTNEVVKKAAEYEFYALSYFNSKSIQTPFLAAYYPFFEKKDFLLNFKEGFDYFTKIFDTSPQSFIAPVYAWGDELEDFSVQMGCKIIQGLLRKSDDLNNINKIRKNNMSDRIIQVRNVGFEPTIGENYDWLNKTIRQIEIAFLMNRPAIISTHRLNYISSINPKNAGDNLKLLTKLIQLILNRWPNVSFSKTSQLYV